MAVGTRVGDSKLVFGTSEETWGYITTQQRDPSPAVYRAVNGLGQVKGVEYVTDGVAVTGTYLFRTGATGDPLSTVGTATTITMANGGDVVYIEKVTRAMPGADWHQVNFEGRTYPNLGS